jgi:hypothetical protein
MNKHWPVAFGLLGAVVGVVIAVAVSWEDRPDVPHYHAGFQVYVNNELQDFSDLKYMKLSPCGDKHEITASPEEEQLEKAHLHDLNGDVVHVHRDGATWRDLFVNMEYDIDETNIIMYINGRPVDGRDLLHDPITPDESVVFFVGENDDLEDKAAQAVTLDRIREVEGLSEDCGAE